MTQLTTLIDEVETEQWKIAFYSDTEFVPLDSEEQVVAVMGTEGDMLYITNLIDYQSQIIIAAALTTLPQMLAYLVRKSIEGDEEATNILLLQEKRYRATQPE